MKFNVTKPALIFALSLLCFQTFGQNEELKTIYFEQTSYSMDSVYGIVDEPADYPGGIKSLFKFLSDNIVYPERALKNKIEGKCYIQFIVTDSGKVENIQVKKGIRGCPECDEAAVRALEKMPRWIPGKSNGKDVNSTFSLPIIFKL